MQMNTDAVKEFVPDKVTYSENKIKAAELLTYNSAAVFLCNTVMIMCIL